jgi:AraC-like DNA-binding protein
MRGLSWQDAGGTAARWRAAPGLWCAEFRWTQAREGLFASSRGTMVGFVLEGRVEKAFGPRQQSFVLRSGDGLRISPRAAYRYRADAGTRLLVLDVAAGGRDEAWLARIDGATVGARTAGLLAKLARGGGEADVRRLADEAGRVSARGMPLELSHNTARLLAVKGALDEGFREPMAIGALAARFRLEPSYLSRHFARTFGVAPQGYVQHLRHEHFLRRLLEGRGLLHQVAAEAGYGDYPSFCRLARQRYGVAPHQLLEDQNDPSRARAAG